MSEQLDDEFFHNTLYVRPFFLIQKRKKNGHVYCHDPYELLPNCSLNNPNKENEIALGKLNENIRAIIAE